jgi:preprotein translocase subunit YajC
MRAIFGRENVHECLASEFHGILFHAFVVVGPQQRQQQQQQQPLSSSRSNIRYGS